MINMAFKTITLPVGSICIYKEYGLFRRLWAKFKHEELPYNKVTLFNNVANLSWVSENKPDWIILVPKRLLNIYEVKRLNKLSGGTTVTDMYQIIDIYNRLRKGTFTEEYNSLDQLNSNLFKEIDANEIASEFCYGIKP